VRGIDGDFELRINKVVVSLRSFHSIIPRGAELTDGVSVLVISRLTLPYTFVCHVPCYTLRWADYTINDRMRSFLLSVCRRMR